jgi:hypothetical protein
MRVEDFVAIIKVCKRTSKDSDWFPVKVRGNKERTIQEVFTEKNCKCCKNNLEVKRVLVIFKSGVHLTTFEAGLLYQLFVLKQVPYDYADYHKCVVGLKFIENIDKVCSDEEVIKNVLQH